MTLGYDPEMRMTSYGSNFTAVYRYDGLRAWKQTSSGKTCFYYDYDKPIFETDGSGNLTAINVFAPDGLVARQSGGTWTQFSFDQQGNVADTLDASGNVLSSPIFDAYGSGPRTGVFGYNGQWGYYCDSETGLDLLGQRYYDPPNGRFLNADPIGFEGGVNAYAYCAGNPVQQFDRAGLETFAGDTHGWAFWAWAAPGNWPAMNVHNGWPKDDVKSCIINTNDDSIGMFGHGNVGKIWVNQKEYLDAQDMAEIAAARAKLGKKKFNYFMVNMCDVMADPNMINNILLMSKEVQGYKGTCVGICGLRDVWTKPVKPVKR